MTEVGYWRPVTEWCLGQNDHFGTCFLAMVANHHVIVTTANGHAEVFSDGEIEYADHEMTGFVARDPATDKGMAVAAMLEWWEDHGWPGDPALRPVSWHPIDATEIPDTIDELGCAYGWFELPRDINGEWDLTYMAVINAATGVGAHAMLIVGAGPGYYMVVTWGTLRKISIAWLDRFGRGYYAVIHPAWVRPVDTIEGVA